jgi:hypothetical protein
MAESTKFIIIRKLLKALGLSDESIDDVIQWIEDLLSGKGTKELADYPYKLRDDFLSPAERRFYFTLKGCGVSDWADVCPKVNLGDVFYATCDNFGERQSYTNKINRKHVDFLLCDKKTAVPLLGIELDDKSHDQARRQERDQFVENVFKVAGLPLERISVRMSYNPKELSNRLAEVANIRGVKVEMPEIVKTNPEIRPTVEIKPLCPKCSAEMILRTAKSGQNQGQKFWGCSNFPRCRSVLPFEN